MLNITEPLTAAGSGGFYPTINENLYDNVTYDPTTSGFYADVTGGPYQESCWAPSSVPFAPPPPGRYFFGVMASSGAWYANWSARSIQVVDANGSTTELTSWPDAPYHPSLTLGGLAGPAYDPQTGALKLLAVPRLQSDGFALFPFVYPGGSISVDLEANFSYAFGGPVDGLTTLFFLSDDLVNTSVPDHLNATSPANGTVAFVNRQGLFDAMTAFPLSARPYLGVRWEPGLLWFFNTLGETEEYVVEPEGTFLGALRPTPSTPVVDEPFNLTAQLSSPIAGLQYTYLGLPPGCSTQDQPLLSCTPETTGSFAVRVFVNDSTGDSATAVTALDVVVPPPPPATGTCSTWTCELLQPVYLAALGGGALVLAFLFAVFANRRREGEASETNLIQGLGPAGGTAESADGVPSPEPHKEDRAGTAAPSSPSGPTPEPGPTGGDQGGGAAPD
jgi:hypothetical protein